MITQVLCVLKTSKFQGMFEISQMSDKKSV